MLSRALHEVGAPAVWTEWDTADPACPPGLKGYGSPTILINGKDVAPGPHPWAPPAGDAAPRCRLYDGPDGATGVPPYDAVRAAVEEALGPEVG